MSDLKLPTSASRDTKWVEGLRGLAAVFVVTSHLALGYADFLEAPRAKDGPARWYNIPFIRVMFEGSPWVSVFLVVTGFVNALKPIKLARAGQVDAALSGLANSCFRRSLRLMLPCTIATVIAWVLAEIGAFQTGHMVMSHWMVSTSPIPSGGVWLAVCTLLRSIIDTWSSNHNELERNQWAMLYFLKGALSAYVFLLATLRTKPIYRMYLAATLVVYGWLGLDPYTFMPIFTGVLLAEVSMSASTHIITSSRSTIARPLPYAALIIGWLLMSFPTHYQKRMGWSHIMLSVGFAAFPEGADIHAYYNHIGVTLIIAAIIFSSTLQSFFSTRLLQWLGARSFAIYLVHGLVLRSFLNWILFSGAEFVMVQRRDEDGNNLGEAPMFRIPSAIRFMWAIPLFLVVCVILADLWHKHVEPSCEHAAKWIEEKLSFVEQPSVTGKIQVPEFSVREGQFGSPLSRATTPRNELDFVLPR